MKRWTLRIIGLAILGSASWSGYDFYRAGYWSLPDLPKGAYTLSFANGLRAIVLDAEVSDTSRDDSSKYARSLSYGNKDRSYLGVPFDVQPWFKDAWSYCTAPTDEEKIRLHNSADDFNRRMANARFEAVCRIEVDGNVVERGLIFSIPKL